MSDPIVRIQGGAQLRSTLKRAGSDLADLKDANQRAGELVAQEARPVTPHRTGRLAGSIRAARQAGRARVQAGGASVPYAGVIHWGWPAHHIKPQPWLSTTAVNTEEQWLPLYLEDIQAVCDSVKGA